MTQLSLFNRVKPRRVSSLSASFSSTQSRARVQSTTVGRLYGLIDRCGVCSYRRVAFFAVPHGAGRLADDVVGDVVFGARETDVFEVGCHLTRDLTGCGCAIEREFCLIIIQPSPTEPRRTPRYRHYRAISPSQRAQVYGYTESSI